VGSLKTQEIILTDEWKYEGEERKGFPRTEKGSLGLYVASGRVYEEFLRRLLGSRGVDVYKEMYYNDPIIGGILGQFELRARQVKWKAKPVDSSPEAERVSAILNASLEEVTPAWTFIMSDALTFMPFGWSLFEVTYKAKNGMVVWDHFGFRAQDTLYQWEFDSNLRAIAMIQRVLFQGTRTYRIPLDHAIHFRTKFHKGNPEGVSVLRTCYRPWFFKKVIEELEAIRVERDIAGIPVLKFVNEEFDISDPDNAEVVKWAKWLVTGLHRNEMSGVVLPPGVSLDLLGMPRGTDSTSYIDGIIRRYNQAIAIALSAQLILIPFDGRFSAASAPVYQQLYFDSMDAWLSLLAEVLNREEKPRLLFWNGLEDYANKATLEPARISIGDKIAMAAFLARLVKSGIITPDRRLEEDIREDVGLPPLDDETARFIEGVFASIDNGKTDGYLRANGSSVGEKALDVDFDALLRAKEDGEFSDYILTSSSGKILASFNAESVEKAISKAVGIINSLPPDIKGSYCTLGKKAKGNTYAKVISLF
jgi:hypothetical protein